MDFIGNLCPREYSLDSEWGLDVPWTLIFASLGRFFVNDFPLLDEEKRGNIFSLIKLAMEEKGRVSNAVATGLLEELHKASVKNSLSANEIIFRLDKESSRYLAAWAEWSGLQ
ncbi:hypothetical protein JWH06_00980 [Xanthomonas melonis]|nr:hypothetical protein [Xanthomonas melonis]MCD0244389.1 hypothetical protein [Xanthomonas melonis]MCD0256779.1 hypothetical protein [Xanthomonas melonis]